MKHLHIYEVGMVSDRRTVRAPSAGAAAIFYSLHLIETNNLFMAVVYTEDGQPFTGEKFWINPVPDEKHVVMVAERVKHHLQWCSVWEGE